MKLKFKFAVCTSIFLFCCSFDPETPPDEPWYFDSVSFVGKNYANIHCSYQKVLRQFDHIDRIEHDYKDYIIEDGWFFGVGDIYKSLPGLQSNVYKFRKYIDIPIITLSNDYVNAGSTLKKTVTTTYSKTYSYQEVYNFAYTTMSTVSSSYNIGIGAKFDPINFSTGATTEFEVSQELKQELGYSTSQSYLFEQVNKENINYNNNNDFNVYFQRCYRQRYEIYFINVFPHEYEQRLTYSDTWVNKYDYLERLGKGTSCSYIFKPIDSPYFHTSIYKDTDKGTREIINLENDSVNFF